MVVRIGQDRQIPSAQGIYAGESSQFVIGFNPGDYVSQISDYSCSTEGVTLALVEGSVNVLRVSLAEGITPGTVATIKFKNQSIIKVTAAVLTNHVVSAFNQEVLPAIAPLSREKLSMDEAPLILKTALSLTIEELKAAITCDIPNFRIGDYDESPATSWRLTVRGDESAVKVWNTYKVYFNGEHFLTYVAED